jgi:hypothetical protein
LQVTIAAESLATAKPKSSSSFFPVLVVLFAISYGLLTLLVVEQDRTIRAQRSLISQLFGDSVELTAMKGKEMQRERMEHQGRAQAPASGKSNAQSQSSPQAPQARVQTDSGKVQRRLLQKPKGVEDNPDSRRNLDKI